jgi:prolyl-tRNA synthetase
VSETQTDAKAPVVKHFTLFLLRGDHDLNEIKAGKIDGLKDFRLASESEIVEFLGCKPGFIGPVGVSNKVRVIADRTVAAMSDFVCGANKEGFHLRGVNFGRDLPEPPLVADVRNVVEGDPSPDGKGTLVIKRGIEVGHIFQLGQKVLRSLEMYRTGRRRQVPSPSPWAATASASLAWWPRPLSRTTTTRASSGRTPLPPSRSPSFR